jgi:hypothetical protein
VMAYMLAHKGKATASETTYNPDDPPEAYSNPSIHPASLHMRRREGRSMGQSGIPFVHRLMERRS